ncbi:tRNA-uridine aminocarboxypropyltransferase [Alkalimarinus coralli]|uniref:tRNA-uridine aminocarboxypropyltransferase n=1 Tax=Alkalimarinus coralli TaxID=2935863 RepID=UPI00202B903D|nr:tRNA-uridine aminocarboxypropyltransferase [Alkalimarinus coralli]
MARERCKVCGNARVACICKWIAPVFNKTSILILQHPDEVKKPLGTAKIVSLCLQNVAIKVGVDFSCDEELSRLLYSGSGNLALLYPSKSSTRLGDWYNNLEELNAAGPLRGETAEGINSKKTLIVLDGTWRNTREIMSVNKLLHDIPFVCLDPAEKSNYRIRKAPFSDYLSTVEAVSQALQTVEPLTNVDVMLECFTNMIDYQISRMGEELYRKNYTQGDCE